MTTIDPTAWTAILLGLFSLAAAAGALRQPGLWQKMIEEIEKSPALQLLAGLVELVAGAILYLANPWDPGDLLTCVMKAIGGFMMIEALAVTAMSDLYFHFWLRSMSHFQRGWAILTGLMGLALSVAATIRLA